MIVPDGTAVIGDELAVSGDERKETYQEIRDNSARQAALFESLGVKRGDSVGLLATNKIGTLHAFFGVLMVGATVVPMNYRARGSELSHLVSDSGISLMITEDRYVDSIVDAGITRDRILTLEEAKSRAAHLEPKAESAEVEDSDVAIMLYTSGTTSLPKGVLLTHGGFTQYVMSQGEAADGDFHGRVALAAPLYHIAGLSALNVSLFSGRETYLFDFEAGKWLETVQNRKVTHAFLVPSMVSLVLRHPDFDQFDLSSLEMVTYGAAPMPPAVREAMLERFPKSISFSSAYGQTETNSTVTVLGADDHRLEGTPEEIALKRNRLTSVGKPLPDVEIRVIDEEGNVASPGVAGEVYLRTGRAMTGYRGKGGGARVILDTEGWVHTGDLGYLDEDGYLFLTGRASDLIIRGGENISPNEIEEVLERHNDVEEAVAFPVVDDHWGERVEAAVRLVQGATVTEDDLIEMCKASLSGAKRPDRIHVVEDFPRTATGKVLRRRLSAEFAPPQVADVAG
ncbi:class I adenylate-forming enzyme family protein [Gryllotalpicola sp.]|uniref:class I adenylate-forming enzyme family protein n=1 Tax=Gryllotalpicola sp. TaxID=1932787 RepID=UPI00262EA366|nr:class I adenylate-forming enzyme family protein [Gryllotalpicola sp.]